MEEIDHSPVIDQFEKNLKFISSENRYQSDLLFKTKARSISDNKPLAIQRLKGLLKKLHQSKERLNLYQTTLNEQEKCGIISKVPKSEFDEPNCYYLPFMGVYKESSESTKLRLVYDGSAKMKGTASLNQLLNTGPCLLSNLCGMLLKFRVFPIILSSDIIKAYHNISINPDERDYTRFLWHENGNPQSELVVYRFNRLPFGLASSQFILNATLKFHILKKSNLHPAIAEKLSNSYYSDNLIYGSFSESEAKTALYSINNMHNDINFPLSKWMSNSKLLKNCFPEIDNSHVEKDMEKMLGLIWHTSDDTIGFNLEKLLNSLQVYFAENPTIPTKRLILSYVSSVFDPMGYLVPVLLFSKHLFQSLCIAKLNWDDQISASQYVDFRKWIDLIKSISHVKISRCLPIPKNATFSLRGYCDASVKCYAACVYIIVHENEIPISARLLICKGRIPPIKPLSIPKLELLAAVLLVRLVQTVIALLPEFSFHKVEYFTDSTTVLYWLNGNQKDWNNFVIKRVSEITSLSNVNMWGYVPTDSNKADLPTRGVDHENIIALHNWYSFDDVNDLNLTVSTHSWNESVVCKSLIADCTDVVLTVSDHCSVESVIDVNKFSSYGKLIRVTCLVIKFINLARKKDITELKAKAECLWIQAVQKKMLAPKIVNNVSKVSTYYKQFQLFEDESLNVFRCKTRLGNANVSFNFKFPILLDRCHQFTKLLILNFHTRLLHAGTQQILFHLRENYYVPKARRVINNIIKKCVRCQKLFKSPYDKIVMPDLPKFRLEESWAFSHVGIDFCGPFLIKFPKVNKKDINEPILKKIYVCVFTCAVTRAVHFEHTYGLTMIEFVKCFRRFTSSRGIPSVIYSDNFSTFKKSDRDLYAIVSEQRFKEYFHSVNVQWKFSTQMGPWTNGFTERLVALLKNCLKKVLFKALVEISEFTTVMKESEAIINDRPLSYNAYDLNTEPPITPNVLIHGKSLCQLPPLDLKFAKDNVDNGFVSKRLRYLERLRSNFWNHFHREYLSNLSDIHFRNKQTDSKYEVKEGTICILKDVNIPRLKWNLVRILKVLPCRDNRIRSVEILYLNKNQDKIVTRRPISSLIPLELDAENKSIE